MQACRQGASTSSGLCTIWLMSVVRSVFSFFLSIIVRKKKNGYAVLRRRSYCQSLSISGAMTVRPTSFSSGSASLSTSAHTGDEYFVPGTRDNLFTDFGGALAADRDTGSHASRCGTEATDCTEATWKEQAHWLSFRDSVYRIQSQLASNEDVSGRRTVAGASIPKKKKNGTFATSRSRNVSQEYVRNRPPKAQRPGAQQQRPPLHDALNNALRSPSPQEIERDLQLYRHEDDQSSPSPMASRRRARKGDLDRHSHLSSSSTITESPTRESSINSYSCTVLFRDNGAGTNYPGGIKAIPESDEELEDDVIIEQSSEDSLDDLVQSLLPSNTGGLADPPTTFHSLNSDAEVTPTDIPKSVDADPRHRLLVEPSPLRPHHHQDDDDDENEGRIGSSNDAPKNEQIEKGNVDNSGTTKGARSTADERGRGQPPSRSSSPHPSIHSAHSSSSSYSHSHSSYSTGTSSSYGSSFDPERLAEETRQRALESHLASTQLKLALVEAERDEMEFELLQRKRKG